MNHLMAANARYRRRRTKTIFVFLIMVSIMITPAVSDNRQVPKESMSAFNEVKLNGEHQVVVDNGFVRVTLSLPDGMITGVQYKGIDNVLETNNYQYDRGYWDIVFTGPDGINTFQRINGTKFQVIKDDVDQIELSFAYVYQGHGVPLNVDKRFVLLRGVSGFYAYAIFERLEGWPELDLVQTRMVFKLQNDKFRYMSISDDKQRIMPTLQDREAGEPLAYPEAVLLKNPSDPNSIGEVDDKYQYSCENKDNRVHGWISFNNNPPVGFWMITPSNEYRTAGPMKQDLTSHVGPITLSMFTSNHYAGKDLDTKFQDGEPWIKVFGPVFVYLNSVSDGQDPLSLWHDAKEQMLLEVKSWPYNFPQSDHFPTSRQRGAVSGQLLVHDRYVNKDNMCASKAYVGLALPGEAGSWQTETKGYQFWVQTDVSGHFFIRGVRAGNYSLYAWVPGFIGDYKHNTIITITPGRKIKLGRIVYEPPRDGPTIWEIGIPDRTAAEFFIPDAKPYLTNPLYIHDDSDRFRQYGLWERYAELYPEGDLSYTVGSSNYRTDWFYAHVTRKTGEKAYNATTWKIIFDLNKFNGIGTHKLRIALASATRSDLHVRINDPWANPPHFATGLIGKDNAIARHGIHGMYWLFDIDIPASLLLKRSNTVYLTQSISIGPFEGVMYDYIRLEGPGPR